MGLGENVQTWLEGDASNSFYEFKCEPDSKTEEIFKNIDLVASKTYHASGIITILIGFQGSFYVSVQDGHEENPLLDSKFPDGNANHFYIYY